MGGVGVVCVCVCGVASQAGMRSTPVAAHSGTIQWRSAMTRSLSARQRDASSKGGTHGPGIYSSGGHPKRRTRRPLQLLPTTSMCCMQHRRQ
eukprot:jgi/Mesvir1/24944/Mv25661-RA.1